MIKLQPTVTWSNLLNFYSTKRTVSSINKLIQDASTCRSFSECFDSRLPVFANLNSPTDALTNDFSSFMLQYDSLIIRTVTLIDTDSGIEYPVTDSTYGKLFSFGEVGFGRLGLRIDWYNVANLIGFGNFNVKIEIANFTTAIVYYTEIHKYRLMPFTCDNADDTVRITSFKNGYIENGNDYRNFTTGDWVDQVRFYGKLSNGGHNTEIDNLLTSNRDLHQIQTQIIDKFVLRLDNIVSADAMSFIKDDILANRMYIDDYNQSNITDYKGKYISLVDVEDPTQHQINGTYTYSFNLVEFNQSTLKRNF